MYAVIAKQEYKQVIKAAIGEHSTIIFERYGIVNIKKIASEISRLSINTLILHSCVADASDMNEAIKSLKVMRPHIRIVFISPESKPGDALIASLIAKGVYDIFCPDKDEKTQEIVIKLQSIIYGSRANYADAVRWDVATTKTTNNKITTVPVTTALIVNTSKCAGSTFLATSLAGAINKYRVRPAVVEMPTEPYLFDALGLTLLEQSSTSFYSYPHIIAKGNQPTAGKETVSDNIIWLVPDSRLDTITNWSYPDMMRLLYCSKQAGVIIVDGGSNIDKDCIQSLLPVVDVVFAVIDPLPVQIIKAENNIKKLLKYQSMGAKVMFVANKWSRGLKKGDFMKLVDIEPLAFIPQVDQANIYKAAYSCHIPYSFTDVQEKIDNSLYQLIKKLLPISVIAEATKKNKNLFRKRRR